MPDPVDPAIPADPARPVPQWRRTSVLASDGVRLAVFEVGGPPDPGRADPPTLLLVHGYPDDHRVWESVAGVLADRFHVVSFDVRGAGESGVPGRRDGYAIDQLADDIELVAAEVSDGPVHLVGHDWGSVQSWRAANRPGAADHFASFTSISGPDAPYAGAWLKSAWRHDRRAALRQTGSSWYIGLFLLPVLPELMWRSGVGHRLIGRGAGGRSVPDAVHGLELYRANLRPRAGERPRPCPIPVQVLAPRSDPYVGVPMQTQAPRRWVPDLQVLEIEGGHWTMVRHPERVAGPVADFILDLS